MVNMGPLLGVKARVFIRVVPLQFRVATVMVPVVPVEGMESK
jgi:hypothetical protein